VNKLGLPLEAVAKQTRHRNPLSLLAYVQEDLEVNAKVITSSHNAKPISPKASNTLKSIDSAENTLLQDEENLTENVLPTKDDSFALVYPKSLNHEVDPESYQRYLKFREFERLEQTFGRGTQM